MRGRRVILVLSILAGLSSGVPILDAAPIEADVRERERQIVEWEGLLRNSQVYVVSVPEGYTPPARFRPPYRRVISIGSGRGAFFWIPDRAGYERLLRDLLARRQSARFAEYSRGRDRHASNLEFIRRAIAAKRAELDALRAQLARSTGIPIKRPVVRGKVFTADPKWVADVIAWLKDVWLRELAARRSSLLAAARNHRAAGRVQEASDCERRANGLLQIANERLTSGSFGDPPTLKFWAMSNVRDPDKLELVWLAVSDFDVAYRKSGRDEILAGIDAARRRFLERCANLDERRYRLP